MASMSSFSALNEQALRQIRKTADNPPKISVYDVMQVVAGVQPTHCSTVLERLQNDHPESTTACGTFKFPGRGQQDTPVTDARGITEIIMVLPSKAAAHFRKKAADVVVRYLGGDLSLVDEIAAIRLAQETLHEEHPAYIVGHTVEGE